MLVKCNSRKCYFVHNFFLISEISNYSITFYGNIGFTDFNKAT